MPSNITYKLKRGTDTALKRANPILAAGEPIVVFGQDGNIWLKIGDGKTPYTELSLCTQIPDNISIKYDKDKISLAGFSAAYSSTIPFKTDNNTMEWVSIDFISSNTKLEYNSNTGEIQLCSLSGKVISTLDAAEFAIAGLIEDIGYDAGNNVLVFVWNTANGRKTSTIPLDNMLSPYTEGNGIKIDGNNISVKVNSDSEKFLFIDESGIGIKGIQEALDLISVHYAGQLDDISLELDRLDSQQQNTTKQLDALSAEISNVTDSIESTINDRLGSLEDALAVNIDSLNSKINSITDNIDILNDKYTQIENDIENSINTSLTDIQDNVDNLSEDIESLSDSVRTLESRDIQGMINDSLVDYVKSSDIEDAIEEATKDLNINLDKIDGGRITDVAINKS